MTVNRALARCCPVLRHPLGAQVLAHWHQTGHRALLFTQTQQMLDIAESAMQARANVMMFC